MLVHSPVRSRAATLALLSIASGCAAFPRHETKTRRTGGKHSLTRWRKAGKKDGMLQRTPDDVSVRGWMWAGVATR